MKNLYKVFSILLLIAIIAGGSTNTPTPTTTSIPEPAQTPIVSQGTEGFPWWNDTVFYEIFVRSFRDSDGDGIGDFNSVTEKLDYLQSLGVKGLWLMPINPSPSYHGYDVTDYYGVNTAYGTMDDFKHLLEEAHKRDIKIIIDFVMNHTSSKHPWFQKALGSRQEGAGHRHRGNGGAHEARLRRVDMAAETGGNVAGTNGKGSICSPA